LKKCRKWFAESFVFPDITLWFVVFVRMSAYMLLFPVTSAQGIPIMVRVGIGALSAFIISPTVSAGAGEAGSLYQLIKLFFCEASTGLTLGMLARFIFYAVEMAGSIIATESGLMLSSIQNPMAGTFSTAPGVLLHWLTVILLLSLDLHHWMISGLQHSFELVPPGGIHLSEVVLVEVVKRASGMFLVALQMTAPMLAASFIVTLVFSLLGRAVPQMNVFGESFPVRTTAGLAVFGLTCSLSAQHIVNHLNRIPEDFIRVGRMLGQ
jgi:flagellar biosynthesis protein FliR